MCMHLAEPPLRKLLLSSYRILRAIATGLAVGFVRVLPDYYVKGCGDASVVKTLAMQARKPEFR